MCKVKVSVTVSTPQEETRAIDRLRGLPNVVSVDKDRHQVVAIVDHPDQLTSLQAAAWAKDQVGMTGSLCPSAAVMA